MNILVCDDDLWMGEMFSTILKSVGHQVEIVCDGQEAFEKILANKNSFDVLVTDKRMPGLSGVDLVEKLRAFKVPLKIILITGFPTELNAEMLDDSGWMDC